MLGVVAPKCISFYAIFSIPLPSAGFEPLIEGQ